MSITLSALQKQRRDTAANWTAENPTLLAGEIGLESDTGYWKVGDGVTAWTSLAYVSGLGAEIPVDRLADGAARQLLQTDAAGTGVEWTDNVDVPGTLDVTGAATFDDDVTIQGDLTVNGTTTTIDTTTLVVEDKNIEIGKVATPTDVTADGGGITLKGSTDKTINWVDATDAWTLSEHVDIASAKEYRIAGTKVLDATSLGSSVLITSANITDGTIVDGDVNASAAIAGTKISPDFGSQNVTTTGTATAAAFIPSGSSVPTNGVYLPSANNVAISSNGVGRIFIDASGNVGVGTTPEQPFHVETSGETILLIEGNDTIGAVLALKNNNTAANSYSQLQGADAGGQTCSAINFYNADNANNEGFLTFLTRPSGGLPTERMRLDSSGRLGLGTSAPGNELVVNNSTVGANTKLEIKQSSGGGGTSEILFSDNVEGRGRIYFDHGSSPEGIKFDTAGSFAAIIDTSGRVGIGVTSPAHNLEVRGSFPDIAITDSDTANDKFRILHNGGATQLQVDPNNVSSGSYLLVAVDGSERARIDSSGRLLVGTSSAPTVGDSAESRVVVQGKIGADTAGAYMSLARGQAATALTSAGTELGQLIFSDSTGGGFASIRAFTDAAAGTGDYPGRLVFSTTADGASSPTERMKIRNDGQITTLVSGNPGTTNFGFSVNRTGSQGLLESFRNVNSADSVAIIGGNAGEMNIYGDGSIKNSTNSYGGLSDYKLKENIVDASSQWDDLKALQVRKYNFKEGQTHTQIGLIAQEVELVSPGLVSESPDRDEDGNDLGTVTKSVNYSVLYMKAVKALQEAMERIETLEAKVAALEGV